MNISTHVLAVFRIFGARMHGGESVFLVNKVFDSLLFVWGACGIVNIGVCNALRYSACYANHYARYHG